MTRTPSCPHESDVLDLVWTGSWPSRAGENLRTHVAGCPVCRDVSAVALAMADLADRSRADVNVPDASLVWYRAEARARQARTRRATRPLFAAEVTAALLLLAGALAALQVAGPSLPASWPGLTVASAFTWSTWSDLVSRVAPATWIWVAAALGALALLAPAAFFIGRMADLTTDAPGRQLTASPAEHPHDH